jgi:hypothetical protein
LAGAVAPSRSTSAALTVDVTDAPVVVQYAWRGPAPTPIQLTRLHKHMAGAGHLTADTGLLIDMRAMTTLPSLDELRATMARIRADGSPPRAVAFVAGTALQYGVARQHEMMLPHTVQVGVFSDEPDALQWLGIREPAASADVTWAPNDVVIRRRRHTTFCFLVFQPNSQDLITGAHRVIGLYVDEASAAVAAWKAAEGGTVWFHDVETGAISRHGAGRPRQPQVHAEGRTRRAPG